MMKLCLYCAVLFAAVLTAQCSSGMEEDLESTVANPPAKCERNVKLDLNAVGAELEFEVQNTLDVRSRYEFSIDGNKSTEWKDCTVSSFGDEIDYWIDLRNIYPIDRITLLSRYYRANGAEVFVGNFSASGKTENQQKCGDSYPVVRLFKTAPLTEFDCHGTHWVQYIRIRRNSTALRSLQICELEVYDQNYKYDLNMLNPQMSFELHSKSNYRLATDGIPDLTSCSRSGVIRQYGSIWLKVNLHKAYAVSKVRLLSLEPKLHRVFVSNSSDFVNKTECKDSFYEYICPVLQAQHILVVYERPQGSPNGFYQMQVCEIEIYYKPDKEPRQTLPNLPCGFPPHLSKATMTTDWKTATYICNDNLIPKTPQIITCLSSGLWSSTLLQCKPTCPNLHSPVRGRVSLPSQRVVGTIAKYSCSLCYELHGNKKRQCISEDNGSSLKWSGSEPTCKIVHCGDPPVVDKATHSVTSKVCGGVALYKCSEGALMLGRGHFICSPGGLLFRQYFGYECQSFVGDLSDSRPFSAYRCLSQADDVFSVYFAVLPTARAYPVFVVSQDSSMKLALMIHAKSITVNRVKKMIEARQGIPRELQLLTIPGNPEDLEDSQRLREGVTLLLVKGINVSVKMFTGEVIVVGALPSDTIRSFKKRIPGLTEIHFHHLQLQLAGKELQDSDKLCYYKIEEGTTLDLVCVRSFKRDMNLLVKSLTGRTFRVLVDRFGYVEDVKNRIRDLEGIPINQQRLIFAGMTLENRTLFLFYNIQDESVLHLVLRYRGGGFEFTVNIMSMKTSYFSSESSKCRTIKELKEALCEKEGIRPHHQEIVHNGKVLNDSDPFSDLYVHADITSLTINVEFVPRKGGYPIIVRILEGKSNFLEVKADDFVRNVKEQMKSECYVPASRQTLYFNDTKLEDNKTLREYDIKRASSLLLIVSPKEISIVVETPWNQSHVFHMRENDTIGDLTSELESEGISLHDMKLLLVRKQRDDWHRNPVEKTGVLKTLRSHPYSTEGGRSSARGELSVRRVVTLDDMHVVSKHGMDRLLPIGRRLLGKGTSEIENIITRSRSVRSSYDQLFVVLEEWKKQEGDGATLARLLDVCDHESIKIRGAVLADLLKNAEA